MGNNGSTANGQFISAESEFAIQYNPLTVFSLPARIPNTRLRFHAKHGDHVDISEDGLVAKRIRSYCKGIVFTSRPIEIGEMVCFRVREQSSKQQQWSGSLRIGLTVHDPNHIADLTTALYLCPDLTNKPGFWAKPLPDSAATPENIIHFQCQENGTIVFGVNGVCKGVAFDNIAVDRPLWAVFDVYGTSVAVELLDPSSVLERSSEQRSMSRSIVMGLKHRAGLANSNNADGSSSARSSSAANPFFSNAQNSSTQAAIRTSLASSNLARSTAALALPSTLSSNAHAPLQLNIAPLALPSSSRSNVSSVSCSERNTNNVRFRPVHFTQLQLKCVRFNRELTGRNAVLTDEGRSARLAAGEFNNGYVFLPRAMTLNETLVIRVEENDFDFDGGLTFGLTTCDPSSLCQGNLPDDADSLLDRPEYWIVAKDVATRPKKGDEFAFTIKRDGAVSISRNNNKPSDFLFVDSSQTFWMFFELYGTTRKISLLGYCLSPPPNQSHSLTQPKNAIRTTTITSPSVPSVPSVLTVNLPRHQSMRTTTAPPSRIPAAQTARAAPSVERPPPPRRQTSLASPSSGGAFSDLIDFNVDLPSLSPRQPANPTANGRAALTAAPPSVVSRNTSSAGESGGRKSQLDRSNSMPAAGGDGEPHEGECCICFEREINSVVYTCGHQVMCYECAIGHFRGGKLCPICRSEIRDIIKTYRT
ncbi:putative Protein neuralized [Hypsibius exemplaris]|uniref:Protein neuralized n=1 Tax=Hypsibius exemplaris TaxID=2072580 RepID=A0A1W0X200_HYPEX|nr:putative Protein neuralized [Hypsibius exemplaris]